MSVIKETQSAVEAKIAELYPENVTVLSRLRGNISNDINAEIAKGKLAVLCFPPRITGTNSNIVSHILADAEMELHICENPALNSTGIDAYDINEKLLNLDRLRIPNCTILGITSQDASPDSVRKLEFIVELKMQLKIPRVAL